MANSRKFTVAGVCLNHCICFPKIILVTSQWNLFCQRWLCSLAWSWASLTASHTDTHTHAVHVFQPSKDKVAAVCLKHKIPLPEAEKAGFLFATVSVAHVYWVDKAAFQPNLSLSVPFQQDYYCSRFYQVWQICQWFIFGVVCFDILAYCPSEHKTDGTDVSDTLCNAWPKHCFCRICSAGLSQDSFSEFFLNFNLDLEFLFLKMCFHVN